MKLVLKEGNPEHIGQVCSVFYNLKKNNSNCDITESFSSVKATIEHVFDMTTQCSLPDILLRLTVIDSMYSTQMNRRYYGLQELAEKLYCLNQNNKLSDLFREFIHGDHDVHLFDGQTDNELFNLFSEKYGIGKDGEDKGGAVSLISKYAYFDTHYGFPIYDSIVCEMYPRLWRYLGWKDKPPILTIKDGSRIVGDATIVAYVKAIDIMIERLGGNISYDRFDRLMWFVGKIFRGNLSLVLSRKDYEWCTKNWLTISEKNKGFDITKVDINNAPFCRSNVQLKDFFNLAKNIKK